MRFELTRVGLLVELANHYTTTGPHVMAKALDCSLKVSEFKLQLNYYIHFQANTLWEGMNSFIPPGMD